MTGSSGSKETSPDEVVLVSDETSRVAHKELYHFRDDSYRIVKDDLLDTITTLDGEMVRVHVCSNWADMVRLATWRSEPATGDIFYLLRNMGVTPEELLPFRDSTVSDLFPWLYYGKRFDILKKICRTAKMNAERHMRNSGTRVYCHLSSADTNRIVASSL